MGFGFLLRTALLPNDRAPAVLVLTAEVHTVGRRGDIQMDTPSGNEISRVHASIYRRRHGRSDVWILEDKSSRNGTFVNGRRISVWVLSNWDEIVFGGGESVAVGQRLISTDEAKCRYRFYIGDPLLKFSAAANPNKPVQVDSECCSVCYEQIIAKETLPCGHFFCLSCLQGWAKHCARTYHRPICPICRTAFKPSKLRPEAIASRDEIQICSFEGMLHDLDVPDCKSVSKASIFRKWSARRRVWFWESYRQIKDNYVRRILFLHLTKATVSRIMKAPRERLMQCLENWEVSVSKDEDISECQRLALLFWVGHFGPSVTRWSGDRGSWRVFL
jgi:hypothetical protein